MIALVVALAWSLIDPVAQILATVVWKQTCGGSPMKLSSANGCSPLAHGSLVGALMTNWAVSVSVGGVTGMAEMSRTPGVGPVSGSATSVNPGTGVPVESRRVTRISAKASSSVETNRTLSQLVT